MDLFAGAGGFSEGFRNAGFSISAGSDNDPDAAATYALNFPKARVIAGDISLPAIKEQILDAARSASVLVGGPPCQAFSQVRNHTRMIEDPRNALYREFVDVLQHSMPMVFVLENVTGMDQMGAREQIETDLALDGDYAVLPQIVDAADFGVPQTRKRLFFVGVQRSLGLMPPQLKGSGATESAALVRFKGLRRPRYQVVIQEHLASLRIGEALADPENKTVVTAADALADFSFYAFEGTKASHNGTLHITSTRFDEPRCRALLDLSPMVVSIHGEASTEEVVFLGGRDTDRRRRIRRSLRHSHFTVKPHPNQELQGCDLKNLCNRGTSGRGVQLELSKGLRLSFFPTLSESGRMTRTQRFLEFVAAVREALS